MLPDGRWGRVFDASLNGIFHGLSSIKSNGMPGHFSIYLFFVHNQSKGKATLTHPESEVMEFRAVW